jgi:hypothetical protein
MAERPTMAEMRTRILREIRHYRGNLPERVAIAWDGYLAALIEWDLISVKDHSELVDLLPDIENNPIIDILLGRNSED